MVDDSISLDTSENIAPSISILDVFGKKFVSGLFWQPLSSRRDYKREAREIGKREGMDVVTIRKNKIYQAGFAPKAKKSYKGMYSLAAAMAGKLGNSWLGCFELSEDKYALIAVHEDAIVPDLDVIGDRFTVETRFREALNQFDWATYYAPESFNLGTESLLISEVLADLVNNKDELAQYRLVQLSPIDFSTKSIVKYVVWIALISAAIYGYNEYKAHKVKKAREEALRAELARKAELEKLAAQSKGGVNSLEHPWVKLPATLDYVNTCAEKINLLPIVLADWVFTGATCEKETILARYKRQDGATSNAFHSAAMSYGNVVFKENHDSAEITIDNKILLGGDDALVPLAAHLEDIASRFQSMQIKTIFAKKESKVVVAPLPGQPAAPPPPPPDWQTYGFNFTTNLPPEIIFSGADWSATRVTKFEVTLNAETAELSWSITGELYGKQ